jgi:copper transport protein
VTRRLPAVLAGALLMLVSTAWGHAPAHGHGILTSSSPANGSSVDQPPTEILLTFTEAPDPELSVVQVVDSAGMQVDAGEAERVPGQPAQLRVSLGSLIEGTYSARWRVTSKGDGHTTVGSIAFGVGVAAPLAARTEEPGAEVPTPFPSVASVAGRWLYYVGVALMLGAAAVGVAVVSNPVAIPRWGLAAAWVTASGGLLLTIADQRAAAQSTIGSFLASSTGHRLTLQAVALAFAGLAVVWAWRRPSRSSLAVLGICASAAMLARALAGHANAGSPRWFAVGTQWVHLVSVGVWVGGLVWLLVALRRGDPGQGRGLARRFSAVAAATLAIVAVSGAVRALDEVGAWTRLFDTRFGVTLLVKVGLFVPLVAVAARSRFRHVPAVSATGLGGLRRTVRAEVMLAAGVLGAAALLAGLPPSSLVAAAYKSGLAPTATARGTNSAGEGGCGAGTADPTYAVAVSSDPQPPRAEGTTVRLGVRQEGKPVTGAKVV